MNSRESIVSECDMMETIVNSTGALVYAIDLESHEVLYANDRCREEFGEVVGKSCFKVLQSGQDAPCQFCPIQQTGDPLGQPVGTVFEWENQNSINRRHYLFNDRIVRWENGRLAKIQVGIDISKQKKLEREILKHRDESIRSFEALSDSTIESLMIYDTDKKCIHANRVASKLFGYTVDEIIGRKALDFVAPESRGVVAELMQHNEQEPFEAQMLRKNGSTFPAILRGRHLFWHGQPIHVSAVMDISDIKEKEKENLRLAHFDMLTGLPNRTLLREHIAHSLRYSADNNRYGALLFIDLDHFKTINDTKGHEAGDLILVETARRIRHVLSNNDMLFRMGGDEFVVLVNTLETDKEKAVYDVGIFSRTILSEMQRPYLIKENDFRMSASIGIVMFADGVCTVDDLMKYADGAMYHAKANGRNTFSFFDPKLQLLMETQALLIERLRKCIERQALTLYYQPQISIERGGLRTVGMEALIRWYDSSAGMISPGEFIPAAEESGLIVPLGEWVLQEAMHQLKCWTNDEVKNEWRLSVNVSNKQFEQKDFVAMVESQIFRAGIDPDKLRLELTESMLIKDTAEALDKIHQLKAMGLSLSIDDFGTGYSSLSYLKQLPIDELKIDRSFIRDLTVDSNDEIIVETIISIGQKFGLEVIAEGVETEEQCEQLLSMGCRYFQGYLFGKPTAPMFL